MKKVGWLIVVALFIGGVVYTSLDNSTTIGTSSTSEVGASTILKDVAKKWSGKIEKIAGVIIILATVYLVIYQLFIA